jgi:hypothetical protein
MSVMILLVGVSVGVLGVYLFVKGWAHFMLDTLNSTGNMEGMDDEYDEDDDDDDGSASGIGEMEAMTDFDGNERTRFIIRE